MHDPHDGHPGHSHDAPHDHSRRSFLGGVAAAGAAVLVPAGAWAQAPGVAAETGRAAGAWLAALDSRQRSLAALPWNSPRRGDWHYVPRGRPGLALRDMQPAQAAAAWDVLGSLLSTRGVTQVRGLIRLEGILGELTGSPGFRDPGNYALVVFGDPLGTGPWAWRLEGHHLSISTVVAPGHGVAVTPAFFGSNPARVPTRHAHAGFRLLGEEEDAAFSLARSLDGEVRRQAVISGRSLGDIVAGPGRELSLQQPEGVPLSRLSGAQQDGVMHILQLYAGTMRDEIASAQMRKIRETGLDVLHFSWAGSLEPGSPHYFRIHGPAALVEYDNTQNGANHVHSLWIDPQDMLGRDLLRTHYRGAH